MSESSGVSDVDGTLSESTGGPVKLPYADKVKFPPDRISNGIVRIPQVRVIQHDITPYLSDARKGGKLRLNGILKRPRPNTVSDEEAHWKRLSLKCVVNLFRDDLTKLKALNRWKTPVDPDSDSSCSDSNMVSRCKICNKSYNSDKKLLNHQKKKHIIYVNSKPMKHVSFSDHVIIHEVHEYHKCRKCPKIFKSYFSLKLHTKQQHKKRKCYICNYCKKSFAERIIFKVHIKLHCEVCGQHFPTKSKCVQHKRNTCKVLKLYKCKTCKEAFYSIMHLKDHSYDHSTACHVCDICKDQFESKCLIAHHISFLHEKSRPKSFYTMLKIGNEKLYLCNFCEESSVERETIERHIYSLPDFKNRAMTGYKDYFFCDVCMKKFSTEQETIQHKWSHFLTAKPEEPNSILKDMLKLDSPLPMKDPKAKRGTPLNALAADASPSGTTNLQRFIKKYSDIHDQLPHCFKPKVMLQKLNLEEHLTTKLDLGETPRKNLYFGKTPTLNQIFGENSKVNHEEPLSPKLDLGETPRKNLYFGKTPTINQIFGENSKVNHEEPLSPKLNLGEPPRKNLYFEKTPIINQIFGENSKVYQNLGETPQTNLNLGETPTRNLDLEQTIRANVNVGEPIRMQSPSFIDIEIDIDPQALKKPIVNSTSKKTLLSRYQCQICGKYFSNNYSLNRHVATQHDNYESLRCLVCEESFVWPSLLQSHKCIRLYHPEMPFDDARPEIHFDNAQETQFDDFNITESDDYMNSIDFEVPAPIVTLTEGVQSGYKLVMQEVPIEF